MNMISNCIATTSTSPTVPSCHGWADIVATSGSISTPYISNSITFDNGAIGRCFSPRDEKIIPIPIIKDVKVIDDKVVFVAFSDGTTEKAVLCPDDMFSLEQGISICIAKKLLSDKTRGNGSSVYNKLVKRGLKVYKNKIDAEVEAQRKIDEEKARRARIAEKKKRKRERREAMKREHEIEIQKEAYVRAMKELHALDEVHE